MIRFNQPRQPVRTQRAIPDTLRYTAQDVERQSGESGVDFSVYHVLRLELTAGGQSSARIKKPLQAVFGPARICFMTDDRHGAYAVVCRGAEDIYADCVRLESALTAHLGQPVNIGVSMQGAGEESLPTAFHQAEAALEMSFFQPEATIYLFYPETCARLAQERDLSAPMERVAQAVHLGSTGECVALLEVFLQGQQSQLHPAQIRAEGLALLESCLAELNKVGADREAVNQMVSCREQIQQCQTFIRYCQTMRAALSDGCRAVAQRLQTGGNAVLDARNYIEENYHRAISLGEVAAAIGVNPGYLSRSFKNKTGINLVDSINRKRVAAAKEALGQGRMKISEIAVSVGIEDTAYFSHLFRKYTGMSPRAYQKLQLHGEGE